MKMVIKKSHSFLQMESSKVTNEELITGSEHAPRSVCDTERDRRQHKDPLKEEEMQ